MLYPKQPTLVKSRQNNYSAGPLGKKVKQFNQNVTWEQRIAIVFLRKIEKYEQ